MEYVIQEETKKALERELQKAKQLRQKQVRQQTIQWSEEIRRKFEDEKERKIKSRINLVTKDVEEKAKTRIEHLMTVHDLALAEIGAAHRAAAQFRDAEKLKELKRLQNQEQARIRGKNALGRTLQENVAKSEAAEEQRRRKEEVRREEDRKVKEMIEERRKRQPLATISDSATNEMKSKPKIPNPKLDQRLAARLQYPGKPSSPMKKKSGKISSPAKHTKGIQGSAHNGLKGKKKPAKQLVSVQERALSPPFEPKTTTGRFDKEVQKRVTWPSVPEKINIRGEPISAATQRKQPPTSSGAGSKDSKPKPLSTSGSVPLTRYFDTGMPLGEKNYVPPKGLAQKAAPSDSPNAWENAEKLSSKAMQEIEEKAKRQEELLRKATERGNVALERAKLEKKLKALQNALLEEAEGYSFLGSGNQEGGLGLENQTGEGSSTKKNELGRTSLDDFMDQFLPIRTDDELSVVSDDETELSENQKFKTEMRKITSADEIDNYLKEVELSKSSTTSKIKLSSDLTENTQKKTGTSQRCQDIYQETLQIIQKGLEQMNQLREENEELPVTKSLLKMLEERLKEQEKSKNSANLSSSPHSSSSTSSSNKDKPRRQSRNGVKVPAIVDTVGTEQVQVQPEDVAPMIDTALQVSSENKSPRTKSDNSAAANNQRYTSGSTIVEANIKTRVGTTVDGTQSQAASKRLSNIESKAKPKVKVLRKKVPKNLKNPSDSTASFSEMSSTETPASKKKKPAPVDTTPEGPYTSTPDGKMKLKDDQDQSTDSVVPDGMRLDRRMTRKDLILHMKASELMQRRRESIEALPVSSSSSSNVVIDDSSLEVSRSPSTTANSSSTVHKKSVTSSSTSRTWETILEEQTLIDDSSFATDGDSELARQISARVLRKISELNALSSPEETSTIVEAKVNATAGSDTSFSHNQSTSIGSITSDNNFSGNFPDTTHNVSSVDEDSAATGLTETEDLATSMVSQSEQSSSASKQQSLSTKGKEPSIFDTSISELSLSAQLKWLRGRYMDKDKPDAHSVNSVPPKNISGTDKTESSPDSPVTSSSSDNAQDKEVKRLLESRGDDISRISPPVRGDTNVHEEMLAVFKSFKEELDGIYIERPPLPSWVV